MENTPSTYIPKKANGSLLIKDIQLINAILYFLIGIQYVFFPLKAQILFFEFGLGTFALFTLTFLSLIGARYYNILIVSLMNSFLLLVAFVLFGYFSLMYSGLYNIMMFILDFTLFILNACALIINLRAQFAAKLSNVIVMFLLMVIPIVFIASTYKSFLDRIVLIFPILMFLMYTWPWLKKAGEYKFHPIKIFKRIFRFDIYSRAMLKHQMKKKIIILGITLGILVLFGIGSTTAWGSTIRIKAADNFTTLSSYWGPPSLKLQSHTSNITVINNNTLFVSNASLGLDPDGFFEGIFAYVRTVYIPNGTVEYCNYSAGAESYPNGTVHLSQSLPDISNVNITFLYVKNHNVLRDLNISHSTCIMNYHGDFIYYPNPFHRIGTTYLFQLLDYWSIRFYLDISNSIEFPHIFNYLNSIPLGYQTLNWANGKYPMFQGISYDFEPGSYAVAPGSPGGINMSVGQWIGNDSTWKRFQFNWYKLNEQNRTLLENSTAEYEKLYTYASSLGYKTYITIGFGEINDAQDGDIDFTRCPVDPISRNPDVLFGHMNYQDGNEKTGRYQVYKGCVDQISLLGDQGKTILLGWIANETKYYTDDEAGFQRYIEDCKIAQAAGMIEIFHAPIYRMQGKWGDDAILRLHQALNEDPKQEFIISVPSGQFNMDYLQDSVENFNYWFIFFPVYLGLWTRILVFGVGNLRIKNCKKIAYTN